MPLGWAGVNADFAAQHLLFWVLLLGQEGHYLLWGSDEDSLRYAKAKAENLYHCGLYPRIFQNGIGGRIVVVESDRYYPTVTETPVSVANAANFVQRRG